MFILSIPGRHKESRISTVIRSIDLAPTIVELLNLDLSSDNPFDGVSLLELIDGVVEQKRFAYNESINDLTAYQGSPIQNESLYAISDGRWKFILHWEDSRDKRHELFDLREDPLELRNVSGTQPEVTSRLRNQLKEVHAILPDPPQPTMDAKTIERLRSLGYVN